jgi:hypothetical protein
MLTLCAMCFNFPVLILCAMSCVRSRGWTCTTYLRAYSTTLWVFFPGKGGDFVSVINITPFFLQFLNISSNCPPTFFHYFYYSASTLMVWYGLFSVFIFGRSVSINLDEFSVFWLEKLFYETVKIYLSHSFLFSSCYTNDALCCL